ncbi:MAG: hypothetical protein LBE79_13650 [Tannerella sp.]|nr:hypothetical protein [Tannerella sp.]
MKTIRGGPLGILDTKRRTDRIVHPFHHFRPAGSVSDNNRRDWSRRGDSACDSKD